MSTASYHIPGGDFEGGGAASRALKEQLKRVGADPAVVRRAMIAAYEAEMNVVIHSHGGDLQALIEEDRLEVVISDDGPGIPDIEQAMRPGFSTASAKARELGFGAGMGLPNIKKNSDRFAIESAVGRGTRVSFTIFLKPQSLYGVGQHSILVAAEKCHQCLRCLHVCPTRAIRVFRGRPEILDYLCVDCTACVAACPTGALAMAGASQPLKPSPEATLLVPAACLVQYGPGLAPAQILTELSTLGFGGVRLIDAWTAALRNAVLEYARTEAPARPVISPACPAVVNLIETRYPSLIPHVAPFLSPPEAARTALGSQRSVFVALCPCQRTALLAGGLKAEPEIIAPATLRAAVLPRLLAEADMAAPAAEAHAPADHPPEMLAVTGLSHVIALLESIENGLAGDLLAVEPWVCDEGCFGSPLLAIDPFLARHRWESAPCDRPAGATAVRISGPRKPRSGLRLDENMARAVQKLANINRLAQGLPGSNCTLCGAPTCAALAEDIVLGRARLDECVRQQPDAGPPQEPKDSP